MRKDFIDGRQFHGLAEPDFVEKYWTDVWRQQGARKDLLAKIPTKPEYKVMAPVLDSLPQGARIVDGGCGLGDWIVHFQERGFDALGLDISRETIAILNERFPDASFAVGDIRAMDAEDASADVYFSWGVFEHFEEGLGPCIREAFRVLKPGGHLYITVPFDNLRMAIKAALSSVGKVAEPDLERRFYQWRLTRAELAAELSREGFEVLEVKPLHKRQGVLRSLHHEFGMSYDWFLTKALSAVIAPVVPGGVFAHMLMATARRPLESDAQDARPIG